VGVEYEKLPKLCCFCHTIDHDASQSKKQTGGGHIETQVVVKHPAGTENHTLVNETPQKDNLIAPRTVGNNLSDLDLLPHGLAANAKHQDATASVSTDVSIFANLEKDLPKV